MPPPATLEPPALDLPVLEFPAAPAPVIHWPSPAPWSGLRMAMTREDFEQRDWNEGETAIRWKFEWNNGYAEAFEERMKMQELGFMRVLPKAFENSSHGKAGCLMILELECWLDQLGVMRKPDFCAMTPQEMDAGMTGNHPVPRFMIEVLSPNDKSTHIDQKLVEYFQSGVQVVWHINPRLEMVIIYTSPHDGELMHGDDLCTAGPAFPEFSIKACEVFGSAKL